MKKLLLNGCSFGYIWNPSGELLQSIGCDKTINISKHASSFQRTFRTTIEWISQNGNPDFVIVPITFAHRWELGIAEHEEDKIDGVWFPLQMADVMPEDLNTLERKINSSVSHDKLKDLLRLYYGIIPDIRTYWDKLFTEVIALSAFLSSRNIPHLLFDMCNDFDKSLVDKWSGFDKVSLIEQNKNILDIFGFCGNKHMWKTQDDRSEHFNTHHKPEQYLILEAFISKYMKQNNIIE
tara:strand:- start:358 stop:1068 length:711 start_codon:yes stop_codon:yes gene_type:complete